MRKIAVLFLVCLLGVLWGLEVGGVTLPDSIEYGEKNLQLNGAGLRKKFIIKVYAGALYLPQVNSNPTQIISANEAMAVRMHFIYKKVDQKKLIDAWNEGFEASGYSNKQKIDKFNSFFTKPALKGDIYQIMYSPEAGTSVWFNNKKIGSVIGFDFKKAVFSIWLGENTNLEKLKEAMLGEVK